MTHAGLSNISCERWGLGCQYTFCRFGKHGVYDGEAGLKVDFEQRCRRVTEIAYRSCDLTMITSAAELEVSEAHEAAFRKQFSPGSGLSRFIAFGVMNGVSERGVAIVAAALASNAIASAGKVLSAACIVLGHSIVDDIVSECCAFAIECDPKGWVKELDSDRRVPLREIQELGADGVLHKELERLAGQLRSKSLPKRAEILFRHAPIVHHPKGSKSDPDYFRFATLKELDELRHDIVHRGGVARVDVSKTANHVDFLHQAAATAVRSLWTACNCEVDQKYFSELISRSPVTPHN
jgi:hypothetical protein